MLTSSHPEPCSFFLHIVLHVAVAFIVIVKHIHKCYTRNVHIYFATGKLKYDIGYAIVYKDTHSLFILYKMYDSSSRCWY